uniref:SprT-like family protein n=1 Tax=Pithovirus LCPAC102 TaxID=2506587 RepID=A0A481Z377_9VIRU|nr:MAG: SprT-like family protein [Pithovirus LCPAC102]
MEITNEHSLYIQLNKMGYIYENNILSNVISLNKLASDICLILAQNLDPSNKELIKTEILSTREEVIEELVEYKDIQLHKPIKFSSEEIAMFPFQIKEPFTFITPDIELRKQLISDTIYPNNKYPIVMNNDELDVMFKLYDYYFFNNMISYALQKSGGNIKFKFSTKMTSAGGTCSRIGICTYIIKISKENINNITPINIINSEINGLKPKNKVNALQLIFEHELVHAILSIFVDDLRGHGKLFKDMVKQLFGHTKITHSILNKPLVVNQYNFKVNDLIYFMVKDKKSYGTIIKLNPKNVKVNTMTGVYSVPYGILYKSSLQ